MPTYHIKGTVTLGFRGYAEARRSVDEEVEADSEQEAKGAVIDRIVDENDYDTPEFDEFADLENSEFKGEVEEVEFTPESEAAIAYRQMQQYAVGTLFSMEAA